MQPNAAVSPAAQCSIDDYELSVEEVRTRLFESGISKSKDTIQRYCREGTLNCLKLGMLRRYFATEDSVDALIETLLQDVNVQNYMQLHEAASNGEKKPMLLPGPLGGDHEQENPDLHEAARTRMQPDAAAPGGELEQFYREQIRVKDDQIRVKDEQIAAMLERDRETNILVRELQGLVAKTFSMLPGSVDADTSRSPLESDQ